MVAHGDLITTDGGVGRQTEVCCEGIRKKEMEKAVTSSLVIKERREVSSS